MVKLVKPARRGSLANKNRDVFSVMDEAFDRFFDQTISTSTSTPRVNLSETDEGYCLEAELPGWSEDDITVTLDDDVLVLEGERTVENEAEDASYRHQEIRSSSFRRSFRIDNVDSENTKARFENGMLVIDMPKEPTSQPKSIEVETS